MEIRLDPILNRASAGLSLAHQVLTALRSADTVTLNFAPVDRMTPSFANAFVMTVMEELSIEGMHERVAMLNRNEQVAHAIDESSQRFARGLRLTSQQPAMA